MKNWINKIRKKITVKNSESQPASSSNKLSENKSTLPIIKEKEDPKIKESGALKLNEKGADNNKSKVIKTKTTTNWFNKLGDNFRKTSSNIKRAIFAKKVTQEDLDYLQDAFLLSDLGVSYSEELINDLKKKRIAEGKLKEEVTSYLESQFKDRKHSFVFKKERLPQIILLFGVNGSGKTTTLAKLAYKAKLQRLSLNIIAADTFRAAAVEQLEEWGKKLQLEVYSGFKNEDPASVIFKGHKKAIENQTDVLLIDTAGRLHNKVELMDELKKIVRIIKKNDPTAPHNKILVLDSTIGQNTYSQLEAFNSTIGITGVIMTKLDSSSKGGSLIAISKKYKTPIHFIGIGEKVDDLIDFNPKDFINALIGENFGEKNESIH